MTNTIILLIMLVSVISSLENYINPSKNTYYSLNNNIVINSNISTPTISPHFYVHYYKAQGSWTTTGNIVQYVDPCLMIQNSGYSGICKIYKGAQIGQQFIDTDSFLFNEKLYQNFTLIEGAEYQLSFDWMSETPNLYSNGVNITWNGKMINAFYNAKCTLYTSTYYVVSIGGTNTLAFQGLGITDNYGILIRNVQLKQLIYSQSNKARPQIQIKYTTIEDITSMFNASDPRLLQIINLMNTNKISQIANNLYSLKQNSKFALGFIMEFNHFLLYSTHLHNYTISSQMFIMGMQLMDDQKGNTLDQYVYPFLKTSPVQILSDFSQQNHLPTNPNSMSSLFIFRPSGLFLDILDIVLMGVPVTLLIYMLGFFFFKMLFRFRISLIFRQYSIFGLFFITLLDGRLQILTFQFLSEVLLLTNSSFGHKMKTIMIIFVYFMCFIFALGSMLVYRWIYRKNINQIYDNCKKTFSASLYMTLSYGLYNIILGTLHRLLLCSPLYQLYSLSAFQFIYLTYITSLLFYKFYENIVLAFALCLMNASRTAFAITLLAYEMEMGSDESIGLIQAYIIYTFFGIWLLTSIICLFQKIRLVVHIFMIECKGRKGNKIDPLKKEQIKTGQNVYILSKDKHKRTHVQLKYSNQTKKNIQKHRQHQSMTNSNIYKKKIKSHIHYKWNKLLYVNKGKK